MALTKKNTKITEHFYSLRNEIDILIKKVEHENKSYYQNYLFFTYGPVSNYTDAIIILCSRQKYNAAHNLLRSLFEAHINVVYHGFGNIERKLAISAKDQLIQQGKALRGINGIVMKYPCHISDEQNSLFNPEHLTQMLEENRQRIEKIIDDNQLTGEDVSHKLINRAVDCDTAEVQGAKEGHFELMYHLPYRLLSSYVHLDLQGLDAFVKKDGDQGYMFTDPPSQDILISQSISIYVALVKDLFDQSVLVTERPDLLKTVDEETRSPE